MEFRDVNLVFEDGVRKGSISFSEKGILSFEAHPEAPTLPEGLFLCPGFIDEHIHGAKGRDVMDGTLSSLQAIAEALPEEGVTSFCPTTMTESVPCIESALLAVKEAMEENPRGKGARILGVHLEGPFISKTFKGAQDEKNILPPSSALLDAWQTLSGNHIRILTFAYEEEGGADFLRECLRLGIVPSLGHSDASGETAIDAFQHGVSCVTHLYNAQRRFHHRDVGVTGAALLQDGVKTELIADLHHSSPEAVRLAFRCKKKGDIVLISDATPAKGGKECEQFFLGNQKITIEEGLALLDNGTVAGSILRLNDALRNVAPLAEGYAFHELIALLTINPANNLGIADRFGSLAIGKEADFVLIDKDFRVFATFVAGRPVYLAPGFHLEGVNQ